MASILLLPSALGRTTTWGSAEAEIKQFSGALETFRIEQGRYPTETEGLLVLIRGPDALVTRRDLNDSWGNPYVYRRPGKHNPNSFDLYSCGEDGKSRTGGKDADDINNWDPARNWVRYYGRTPLKTWILPGAGILAIMFLVWFALSGRSR
jgi:general secretion pathway protein G